MFENSQYSFLLCLKIRASGVCWFCSDTTHFILQKLVKMFKHLCTLSTDPNFKKHSEVSNIFVFFFKEKVCREEGFRGWIIRERGGDYKFSDRETGRRVHASCSWYGHARASSHAPSSVPSLKFYRGTNPTKTIIKLCTLQPSDSERLVEREELRKLIIEFNRITGI